MPCERRNGAFFSWLCINWLDLADLSHPRRVSRGGTPRCSGDTRPVRLLVGVV